MMSSSILPPGFRFHPTDQELVVHYLKKKVSSPSDPVVSIIADVDLYKFNPWELPGKALFGESEWFFFTPRDRKYPNGARPNRKAASGYWKATGTDKPILTSNGSQCLGCKKALVFYRGHPPKGVKTNWMMHEYRLLDDARYSQRLRGSIRLDDWVLCRVRYKGPGFQQQGDNIESSSGSSSPFPIEYLNDQEMMRKKNNNKIPIENENQFQTYPGTSKGREVADEQGHLNFNRGASENSTSDLDSDFQTNTNVSSFKTALDKIRRVLSIGALDELVTLPPNKRLRSSSPNNMETASIFQVSSASTLDSFPPCYSGFII